MKRFLANLIETGTRHYKSITYISTLPRQVTGHIFVRQRRYISNNPNKFDNEHIKRKLIESLAGIGGKNSSNDDVKIIREGSLSRSRNITRIILLSALTVIASFTVFITYNVIHLKKTVILPLYYKYNSEFDKNIFKVDNDYKALVNLVDDLNIEEHEDASYINLRSLEDMINYEIFSKIANNELMKRDFKFPLDLQEFRFKQEDFSFKLQVVSDSLSNLDRYNIRLNVLEISHSDTVHNFCNFEIKERLLYVPLDKDEWKSMILSNVKPIKQVENFPSDFQTEEEEDYKYETKTKRYITVHAKTKVLTESLTSDGDFYLDFHAVYNTSHQLLKIKHCALIECRGTRIRGRTLLW